MSTLAPPVGVCLTGTALAFHGCIRCPGARYGRQDLRSRVQGSGVGFGVEGFEIRRLHGAGTRAIL